MKVSELEMLLESARALGVTEIYFDESRDGVKSLTNINGADLKYNYNDELEMNGETILVLR